MLFKPATRESVLANPARPESFQQVITTRQPKRRPQQLLLRPIRHLSLLTGVSDRCSQHWWPHLSGSEQNIHTLHPRVDWQALGVRVQHIGFVSASTADRVARELECQASAYSSCRINYTPNGHQAAARSTHTYWQHAPASRASKPSSLLLCSPDLITSTTSGLVCS